MPATKIEWTATTAPDGTVLPGYTFNSWLGCSKISDACAHCYAESWSKRSGLVQWGNHPRRRTSADYWRQPLKWNRLAEQDGIRRKVFCASLADVFDNQVDPQWRTDLWALIAATPHLDWLLLTKRPQNIAKMHPGNSDVANDIRKTIGILDWPWPNVWFGTTIENRREGERRAVELAKTPAVMRFWSCEPLLEDLGDLTGLCLHDTAVDGRPAVGWVITGGESGPGARPSNPQWFRNIGKQCIDAGIPWFHKQNGEFASVSQVEGRGAHFSFPDGRRVRRVGKKLAGALLDGAAHKGMPR